jgi:O-antigen/teichoic acid export membrane protein
VPLAELQRKLDFKRIGAFEAAGALANAVTAGGLAVAGLNGEAIVLGAIAASAVTSGLALAATAWSRPRLDLARARALLGFGLPAAGASLVYTTLRNVDYAVVGAQLSASQLGIYTRAYQLGVDYQGKLSSVMLRIAFPVFSRTPDLDAIRRIRIRIVRTHATVLIPLLAILVGVAPDLIPFVFGDQWDDAVLPTQLLAVSGMFVATMTGTGPLLLALGRPRLLLGWNAVMAVAYLAMLLVVVEHGLTTLCIAVDAFFAAMFVSNQVILKRVVGVGYLQTLGDAAAGVVAGAAGLLASGAFRETIGEPLPLGLSLVFAGLLGLGAAGIALRGLFPSAWEDVALIVTRVLGRGPKGGSGDAGRVPRPSDATTSEQHQA